MVALAIALAGCGSTSNAEVPAYALYANPENRLPRSTVARLYGSIGIVDGQDVTEKGTIFELRPGCHVVWVHSETIEGRWKETVSGGRYAFRMKPGFTYRIRRGFGSSRGRSGPSVQMVAEEESPTGEVTAVPRIQSQDDVVACKEWEKAEPHPPDP